MLDEPIVRVQEWLNDEFHAGLVVNGEADNETKSAIIAATQKVFGLEPNGEFGPETKAIWKIIKRGSTGLQAQLMQAALICAGYYCNFDGKFSSDSVDALKRFQRNSRMIVSGFAGKAVAEKIFEK